MESMEIVAWRCKYLLEIAKNRAQNCLIFCLDETYFSLKFSVSKGKRVVTCYADFADNAFFLSGKDISKCYVDYHQNMNCQVHFDAKILLVLTQNLAQNLLSASEKNRK